jgi:hypothetical protein
MKKFSGPPPSRGIYLLATPLMLERILVLLTFLVVFSLSGCLFGGKKETAEEVAAPQGGSLVKGPSLPPVKEPEPPKETKGPPEEGLELYDDLLSRLSAMEKDQKFLRDKVSMLEFLVSEASKESKKTREEMQAELAKLQAQLSEYNALMLRILDRVSKEPSRRETPPSPH